MKQQSLARAVQAHVQPGMLLHFGSTPSRSNAAIVELVRQFRGQHPRFTFSATGYHSTAHLLSVFRLGERLIGCFYGDNYPQPRPNALYQTLLNEGVVLEQWSLASYVLALRAGAMGQPGALIRSLSQSSLGQDLAKQGRYREVPLAGAKQADGRTETCGMVLPLAADVSFLHAAVGDEDGHAWFWPPHCEGFHGALGARRGVIVTVDRILPRARVLAHPELIPIPAARVLAICEAPYGAHPQPVHCGAESGVFSYRDDFESYLWWRQLTTDRSQLEAFERDVLSAEASWAAYRAFVGEAKLERLRCDAGPSNTSASGDEAQPEPPRTLELNASERLIVLAARYLAQRVRERRLDCMLAGIGQAFSAARLCKLLLARTGTELELMVETGFSGFGGAGALGDSYLLSQRNIALSTRLSNVESVLCTLVCGAQNRCLGVIGGAQVDPAGNVNSTFVDGKLLVGSGGACDIALGASDVVVLARSDRLVSQLEYITSPGQRVRAVVIEHGVLERTETGWRLNDFGLPLDSAEALGSVPWCNVTLLPPRTAQALDETEVSFVLALRAEAKEGGT